MRCFKKKSSNGTTNTKITTANKTTQQWVVDKTTAGSTGSSQIIECHTDEEQ